MNAHATITDPILAELIAAHKAREVYPTGHVMRMTREIDDRSRALSVATCECGVIIRLLATKYLEMDGAIEAHWQKFDHADDRGQPMEGIASREDKQTERPDSVTFPLEEPINKVIQSLSDREAPELPPSSHESNKPESDADHLAVVASPEPADAEIGVRQLAAPAGSSADDDDRMLRAAEAMAWRDDEPPLLSAIETDSPGEVGRPLLRWHGGKWKLAPWIMSFFPEHRIYVEPFGGAGSVLLRKLPVYAEIYNDLDEVVVNLFRVLRDKIKAARLIEALRLTPFSRAEFNDALEAAEDDVDRARRLIVRSYMGFGSNAHSGSATAAKTGFKSFTRPDGYRSTGFRANSNKSGTTPAHDWKNYPEALPAIIERLRGIIVEQRPGIDVMKQHDGGGTLHYVDPPYLPETRSPANKYDLKHRMYRHELTVNDHRELLAFLQTLEGYVVLSGYPSPLYNEALPTWRRVTCAAHADGARDRTEVLWINPACAAALDREHPRLFDLAALDAAAARPRPLAELTEIEA